MILNLTQHTATPEQGVVEPADKATVAGLLTFEELPTVFDIAARARALAEIARAHFDAHVGYLGGGSLGAGKCAMIGGAPFLMSALEGALTEAGIRPLYAFSLRESAETVQPDGSVRKTQVFRHIGFVEV